MGTLTVQELVNGERNYVIHVVGDADDVGDILLVDVSELPKNSKGQPVVKVRLDRLDYNLSPLSSGGLESFLNLRWDGTGTSTNFETLVPGQNTLYYRPVGGLNNETSNTTGDVLKIVTRGSSYTMTLSFTKKY